jgi:hypothetical protein
MKPWYNELPKKQFENAELAAEFAIADFSVYF